MNILFWSGGKDSYLTLNFYRKQYSEPVSLLTTYNMETDCVPFQNINLETIKNQASKLGLNHFGVGLPPEASNDVYVNRICKTLVQNEINCLIFGDWHLRDIRDWREQQFEERGYKCLFPIWKKSQNELITAIENSTATFTISAVDEDYVEYIEVGQEFNRAFVENLPDHIDPMGEKGEFHTQAKLY